MAWTIVLNDLETLADDAEQAIGAQLDALDEAAKQQARAAFAAAKTLLEHVGAGNQQEGAGHNVVISGNATEGERGAITVSLSQTPPTGE